VSFRTKIFLSITATVVLAVWIVAAVVSALVTQSFERRDAQRTAAVASQLQREIERRGADIARRVQAIADSDEVQRLAVNFGAQADTAQYYSQAQMLAREQSLDFLELVAPDGNIISSAEWPARFGYKEDWLAQPTDWNARPAFLKKEDLADGSALGLIAVRGVKAGDAMLFVAGGQRLDNEFLDSLPATDGVRVKLYRNFEPLGPADALVDEVRRQPGELTRVSGTASTTAIPLRGRDRQLLAILLIDISRAELMSLKRYIQGTAAGVGGAGVLLALILSFWTASRVTRPLRGLASRVREVAAGQWNTRAEVSSSDEVGQLARDFNAMTQQLVEQRDRMIQAERVAAWRELARRLAHELKNPLFPLQITIENLQRAREVSPRRFDDQFDEVFRESTATLLAEVGHLKTIIGRFSDFAKMPAPQVEAVDVNQIAREVMQLFEAQIAAPGRPRVDIKLALDAKPAQVEADPDQLRRAFSNLILNALDAMPKGGALELRTSRHEGKITVEVSDTGGGLTPEECDRLFTPYYTTKQHGTGLGLAIVQSVVSDHKGTITVHSEAGRGTTFRIELKA
jgi:two-component system, NtrC family, nitrogen regulation sensor histidine kinase NtrY